LFFELLHSAQQLLWLQMKELHHVLCSIIFAVLQLLVVLVSVSGARVGSMKRLGGKRTNHKLFGAIADDGFDLGGEFLQEFVELTLKVLRFLQSRERSPLTHQMIQAVM